MSDEDRMSMPVAWRGSSIPKSNDESMEGGEPPSAARVLLLLHNQGNRQQLARYLGKKFEIVEDEPESGLRSEFDLAIVDGPAYGRFETLIGQAKEREQPVFLPVMLLLPRKELQKRAGHDLNLVDEFIVAPIDAAELLGRVNMLLRTRESARAQRVELARIVNHDETTGLATHSLFLDRVETAIQDATLRDERIYVLVVFIPLKNVMRSLSHGALERAIELCASRLKSIVDKDQQLARLTSEYWGALLPAGTTLDELHDLSRRLGGLADDPIELGEEKFRISPYIGAAIYPDDAASANAMLTAAYDALSRAEEPGEPYFYSSELQSQALEYLRIESRLHDALEQNQFELWLQPQVSIEDQKVVGVEGLIRWRLPDDQMVSPGQFIPVAESSGLITRIDSWVLESAIAMLARWRAKGIDDIRMSINTTPQDLAASDFIPWLTDLMKKYDVPPRSLEIELTETMFCNSSDDVLEKLTELRDYGIKSALDDFGTGYSSLSYLHELPINILKIDKTFMDRVLESDSSDAVTSGIIGLAHHFGLEIVAEGIEHQGQMEYLSKKGVQTGQGYLIAKPMPEDEFLKFLENSKQETTEPRSQTS